MSVEQKLSPLLERPPLEEDPRDSDLQDSVIIGSPEEIDALWAERKDQWAARYEQTNQKDENIRPKKTHAQYIRDGQLALEAAIQREENEGLDAAAPLYRVGGFQFLGALSSRPLVEGEVGEADPSLLLQYGTCLDKEAQGTKVAPYTSAESQHIDRRGNLKQIASRAFREAGESVMGVEQLEAMDTIVEETSSIERKEPLRTDNLKSM